MYRYKTILVVFLLLNLSGCKDEPQFSDEKITSIIADMRIAKSAAEIYPTLERDSIGTLLVNKVYEIHHIDKASYDRMVKYLSKNPELYIEIEKKVMQLITDKQGEINSVKK